jgi:hypothetical protein
LFSLTQQIFISVRNNCWILVSEIPPSIYWKYSRFIKSERLSVSRWFFPEVRVVVAIYLAAL